MVRLAFPTVNIGDRFFASGDNTKIALPETKLGIIPGAGGTQRLTRIVGVAKSKELIFTGRHVQGPEAERIGTDE